MSYRKGDILECLRVNIHVYQAPRIDRNRKPFLSPYGQRSLTMNPDTYHSSDKIKFNSFPVGFYYAYYQYVLYIYDSSYIVINISKKYLKFDMKQCKVYFICQVK